MELFFVLAVLQIIVATVLIADHQRLQVGRQVTSQSLVVRSPNRVDHSAEFLRCKRVAIAVRLIPGIRRLDSNFRAGESALRTPRHQRKIEIPKFLSQS